MSLEPSSGESLHSESTAQFESRKVDHIRLALDVKNQASGQAGFERVELLHEAFPELDFSQVSLMHRIFKGELEAKPLLVSSMTAGHHQAVDLNGRLAEACQRHGWLMGVGSQRRELRDSSARQEWKEVRRRAPRVKLLGNLGLSQLIRTSTEDVRRLADSLEASAMIIHSNPLQECLQPEGTPDFAGGLKALEKLVKELGLPVIVKETGCGFSAQSLSRLKGLGVMAVDISGFGGTHWGRIEGGRSQPGELHHEAAKSFANWGIGTVDGLSEAVQMSPDYEIWASGGVRSGRDVAILLAMGAQVVGLAQPILKSALEGEKELDFLMSLIEYELKVALFCTGSRSVEQLQEKKVWRWRKV